MYRLKAMYTVETVKQLSGLFPFPIAITISVLLCLLSIDVRMIIDSVIEELYTRPDRKFIFVEISFFSKWWNQQDDFTKAKVKRLITAGMYCKYTPSTSWSITGRSLPDNHGTRTL